MLTDTPTCYLRPPGLDPGKQAELFLRALHHPSAFIELRAKAPGGGMVQSWHTDPHAASQDAVNIGALTDVYAGVLPRGRKGGGADSVIESRVLWVEADTPMNMRAALRHSPRPAMVVCSSEGRAHCYWQLSRPVPVARVAEANRRLAHRLGGDMNAVDPARILRIPGTFNHKRARPFRVFLAHFAASPNLDPGELLNGLPDPPAAPPSVRPRPRLVDPTSDSLRALASRDYAPALTGRGLLGLMMQCPLHGAGRERTPSFHVGGPDAPLWHCFGCGEGGDIFRLAARLWALDETTQFRQILKRLAGEFL